ncbi:membrane-bound PQQ-dependent dehydrogenase, glucose/quinate/shikimate family (plasmid) [Paroceanicella profunda]|uniref:Membrane-bound PQQ-dependent dehydrogenase, glucose/quinate/shikimate family n=1 Tax=Paroceanicella profunda TaxID=2579971 RepID=A0A5B8G3D8_9RHOB|nr:PQQ-binding-like beta-propeller repeat protein [Paroceanicella profunda]QDL93879.1 membrane-bound PQQ-dependent dehydrogenase, glucose/quinate/shikimate family [Paroceanicella profunda]
MYRSIVSILVLILGVVLAIGGAWLAWLGGSWFYMPLGVVLAISGGLFMARAPSALALYGLALLGTLAWSIWEVGFDWWALAPRGALLVVFGILMLIPAIAIRLAGRGAEARSGQGAAGGFLALSLLVSAGVAGYAVSIDPHDTAGAFPNERMNARAEVETGGVPDGEWQAYGRTSYGRRYSPLDQITPGNVDQLEVAWTYHTGQERTGADPVETTYEVTPLVFDDTMYVCTPFSTVIALDPETGQEKWRFDPELKKPPRQTTQHMTCRGVSYFDGSRAPAPAAAATTTGPDAAANTGATADTETGTAAPQAADSAAPQDEASALAESDTEVTTQAAGVPQNVVTGNAKPGDPNPQIARDRPGTPGSDASCVKRLFVPTSDGRLIAISAQTGEICPGFGGADGTVNLWANMPNVTPGSAYSTSPPLITDHLIVVGGTVNDNVSATSPSGVIRAFDINTGALVWNFDSKNPDSTTPIADGETYSENAPNSWSVSSYDPELGLIYVPMGNQSPDQFGGNRSDAVERFSSSVTALDAETGQVRWVYQTVHHDLWDMDVPAQPSLIDLTIDGATVPALVQPTKQGEVFVLNRETGEPVLPVTEVPAPEGAVTGDFSAPTQPVSTVSFNPPKLTEADMWGATPVDQLYCRIRFHELTYDGRYTPPSLSGSIVYPGNFGTFNWGAVAVDPERQMMFAMPVYLAFTSKLIERPDETERMVTKDGEPVFNENFGARYASEMGAFTSPLGLPCQQPPWGYVAGVDLTTGKTVYEHRNGTVRDLSPLPLPFKMGVPGIGGPIVTRGGVAFLSGTMDYYVRGYDMQTGRELWRARLPSGGQATPSTYMGKDGRQYLVVVAGGHGSTGTKAGDSIIAYALPKGT